MILFFEIDIRVLRETYFIREYEKKRMDQLHL